ncbi:MAG: hypothetical protein ACXV3C_06595 [Actinomycetes bacterium]
MTDTGGLGRSDVARCWAGFASLGAGLVHLAVVDEHLAEWIVFGLFFAAVGAAQLLWALAAIARDRAPWLRGVVAANLGLVALWAVTRTSGLPIGPEPFTPEPVGRADVLSVVLELGTVLALVFAARSARSGAAASVDTVPPRAAARFVALLFAGALAVSAITTPALAATPAGQDAHPHFHGTHPR